ncbi:N-acetylglutamate synthase, GNAT family [Frankineae bacterium MT45]|nr:N-acetylglutamate synthase, GNAT family [Frankineae bacterium MT45]
MPAGDSLAVSIRPVEVAEAAVVAALRRSWSEENAGAPLDDEAFEADFGHWFADESPRRVTYVAESDGLAIGMMNLVVFHRMPRPSAPPACWCYLGNAFVLKPYRNHGVGQRLLSAVVTHARELNAERIVLAPSERSVPFYRRAGFGAATMLMALPLPGRQPGSTELEG